MSGCPSIRSVLSKELMQVPNIQVPALIVSETLDLDSLARE